MRKPNREAPAAAALAAVVGLLATAAAAPSTQPEGQSLHFALTYGPAITDSFTGRVYVMLSTRGRAPRFGPSWFGTEPFFSLDVEDWKPDTPIVVDDSALGFPGPPSGLKPDTYTLQAVMRRNLDSPSIGRGPGSAYSEAAGHELYGGSGRIELRIDRLVEPRPFGETDRVKLVELRSELLSDFYGRDVIMKAAVILPAGYDEHPDVHYPAFYWIGGFGSNHRSAPRMVGRYDATGYGDRIVRVVLDPSCYGGHHVFADSDNNGPRGAALIGELIPHLEQRFRLVRAPTARFLSGHSSGGWSSLWLQVTYTDFFGGVWSLAPDPVDFTDFQRINLYEPGTNMFRDEAGDRRPVARRGGRAFAWYEPFTRMEVVYGDGGQLRSFDWVFSPSGPDGSPRRLYDPATGQVDPGVAQAWKRYDIRHILKSNWTTVGPKLSGKISVIVGEVDTFYLEGAVRRLAETLDRLGSDAVIEIVPGASHGSFVDLELRRRIDEELVAIFEKHHGPLPVPAASGGAPAPAH